MTGTALIARAGQPLGPLLAQRVARDGYDVAIAFDQREDPAREALERVQDEDQEATILGGRVGDPMVARQLVRRTAKHLDQAPSLVTVLPRTNPFLKAPENESPEEAFHSVDMGHVEPVLQADLKGPWSLLSEASQTMTGQGSILLTTPPTNLQQGPLGAPTRAAASALGSLVHAAAKALEPLQVNLLSPGPLPPPKADSTHHEEALGDLADAMHHLAQSPDTVTGQTYHLTREPGSSILSQDPRVEDEELDLPGIEKRIEPPDPEERIDLE